MIEKTINFSRRSFVGKTATAAAGISIAPGVFLHQVANAKPADQAATSEVRWGMLINTNKCATGCTACVSACNEENGIQSNDRPESDPQWIRKVKLRDTQTGHVTSLPMMCQHCENPPCVDVCPTGASMKREDGIVLVDKHICIGCRYCMMACPYKARSFVHETITDQKDYAPRGKGTVESCTMCVHRVDDGGTPACVEACNAAEHGAMIFGDLKDPQSEISKELEKHGGKQIRADLRLNTGVRYQGI
ncbi:MAG: 4Fe-4S dicluster domain-containing protein [Gammaproteobacteria bacterium]|nr:4Fe-4S dicluster domain-containing protein [Gammaproteobacteria bacterium]MCW8911146.1 4Fe-4S dicluster domain-containing protein [Gammaproteobacteria bacterium]MCW9005738.1 4Fe-4S dicluster domain-containing protein [Gammaproteobacteria bacterium]MCW9055894.1 4Fe-4S dicluster domain-containing protein [Gammaproteobacteria bacterium]